MTVEEETRRSEITANRRRSIPPRRKGHRREREVRGCKVKHRRREEAWRRDQKRKEKEQEQSLKMKGKKVRKSICKGDRGRLGKRERFLIPDSTESYVKRRGERLVMVNPKEEGAVDIVCTVVMIATMRVGRITTRWRLVCCDGRKEWCGGVVIFSHFC